MSKLIAILIAPVFLLSFPSHSDDGWNEISGNTVSPTSCFDRKKFVSLFELSISGRFSGTAHLQYISEINELSLMNCPKQFLLELKALTKKDQNAVLDYFGVIHDPQDIARKLTPLVSDPEVGKYIESEFGGYLVDDQP